MPELRVSVRSRAGPTVQTVVVPVLGDGDRPSLAAPDRISPSRGERLAAWALVSLGGLAVFHFASWWASPGLIANAILFAAFSVAAWFSVFRMVANWVTLLHVERPRWRPPRAGLRIDVVTTAAPGEPVEMFRTTLAAMVRIRYPHNTTLLDDSGREELRALCRDLGVRYMRREHPGRGAKAGNVNHALPHLDGEFIAIFDPDHVPQPEFLDRVLGYFDDLRVGYVQAAQAYRNQRASLVARGAAEQTYELYGPTMMGLHGLEAPLLFGCHTTFRRAALDGIGGYAVHNAEDLRTCMRVTAAGWRGVYVPEILARGLVPADLATFLRQQFRWSHSVFDLFFRDFWTLAPRWTMLQRAAFFMVGTFYFTGVAILINLILPVVFLGAGLSAATAESFVLHVAPLVAVNLAIRRFGQRYLLSRDERGWHLVGMVLLFASCFAHTAGLLAAAARLSIPYFVTAKRARPGGLRPLRPHIAMAVASVVAVAYSFLAGHPAAGVVQLAALWNAVMMTGAIWFGLEEPQEVPEPDAASVEAVQARVVPHLVGGSVVGGSMD